MAMERGLDTGAVYETITVPLDHSEYASELEFKLGSIAAEAAPGILGSIWQRGARPGSTGLRRSDGLHENPKSGRAHPLDRFRA